MKSLKMAAALLLALGMALLAGCGVAEFTDEEIQGNAPPKTSSSGLDSSAAAAHNDKNRLMEAVSGEFNALVAKYNDGVAEFEAAIKDEVELPKDHSKKYDTLGEALEDFREKVSEENLPKMVEEEIETLREGIAGLDKEVEGMLATLRSAVEKHGKDDSTSASA